VSQHLFQLLPEFSQGCTEEQTKIKKVAVFYAQNDAFNKSETEIFSKRLGSGLDLVTVQKFQTTDTDFQTQATNAINLKPDLVIISGLAADGGNSAATAGTRL